MRRIGIIIVALLFTIGSSLYAAGINAVKATAEMQTDMDKVIVPIELQNAVPMTALDLPLKFSDGVVLEEVLFDFEKSRSADFDFKWAKIDNADNTVIIGLIPMVYGEKSDLPAGSGEIARLVFSVEDPNIETIELTPTTMENPSHSLMLVYTDYTGGSVQSKDLVPEFSGISVPIQRNTEEPEDLVPTDFGLKQNAPNPFNPKTSINYSLPKACNVTLTVYNVLGQNVRTLINEFQEAGYKSVIWDGCDNGGNTVASGIYFYHLEAGDQFSATKKMMMLK
jgi:hypothetical protein